jgi:hypothetical protein
LFDDKTQSTVAKFGLFYARLFKSTYYLKVASKFTINNQTVDALQKLELYGANQNYRILELFQLHTSKSNNNFSNSWLLDALFHHSSSKEHLLRPQPDIFKQIEHFTLEEIALRSNYRASSLFEWVTDPFYFNNSSVNSLTAASVYNNAANKMIFEIANTDIDSRR